MIYDHKMAMADSEDMRKTITFVQTTINPALDSLISLTPEEERASDSSLTVLKRECDNLLDEVESG